MAGDSQLPNIGGNGFIWILVAAAATYLVAHQIPLSGSRPASTDRSLPEHVGEQRVDARLWQDPFAAVLDAMPKLPELKPEYCRDPSRSKKIETYCRPPWEAASAPPELILMVSVSGTFYSEDQEARRRRRYAVLAGLDAEGFVPEDAQHIGFYWPDAAAPLPAPEMVSLAGEAEGSLRVNRSAAQNANVAELPKFIPYEWFKPRPERREVKPRYQRILLLWFNEDVLQAVAKPAPAGPLSNAQDASAPIASSGPAPLQQYARLLCGYLRDHPPGSDRVKILGPQLSTTLKAMVDEADRVGASRNDWSGGACPNSVSPSFYVAQATVSDATLLPAQSINPPCIASNTCLTKFFEDTRAVPLFRVTATDDALARALGDELHRRGVALDDQNHRPSHIALISEWDTLYGRALPDAMARCLERSPCEPAGGDPFRAKNWLHSFKYVRGLDGQLPNVGDMSSGTSSKDGDNKQDKDNQDNTKNRPDPNLKARAEGQSQFDYLQRLGDRIRQLDAELRLRGDHGIEAIGVLGFDLYDKLLVLQALRPLLPDAWFFTTDLDALLLHPTAQNVTRNLLVASGFGLQLRPDVQGATPPFRNNYQTGEYLAARVAIRGSHGPDKCWLSSPLLFEIGSSREFQFSETLPPVSPECKDALLDCEEGPASGQPPNACTPARGEGRRADHDVCKEELMRCRLVQPIATSMLPQFSRPASIGLVGVAFLVGTGLVGIPLAMRRLREPVAGLGTASSAGDDRSPPPFSLSTWALVALGIVILLVIAVVVTTPVGGWLTQGGQPILLLEGISLWPTIFLRLATLVLCIWLIVYSLDRLAANMRQIEQEMHLGKTREDADAGLLAPPTKWSFLKKLAYWFGYDPPEPKGDDVSRFWRRYFDRGRIGPRLARVLAGVVVVLALWGVLVLIFGNPHTPTRGYTSAWAYHAVTLVLFVCTLVLIFFVADATWLCWRLTRDIRPATVFWPEQTLQEFSRRLSLPTEALADCLDLLFLARRSRCITALLYGPFLIIALIVISHSRFLANYGRSIPALVTLGVAVLIVIGCAVALRLSAEATRAEARRRLTERLLLAKGQNKGVQLANQLELVMRRIEELREGAFSPFSQQPVVRAMLLPLGGFGGTALLNYLLVPGFG
jgi:hypothetical protein